MVQGPGETAEELRARHIRTNPPKNTDELGSAEDIEAGNSASMSVARTLELSLLSEFASLKKPADSVYLLLLALIACHMQTVKTNETKLN